MTEISYADLVERLRNSFESGVTRTIEFRKSQLKALYKLYDENTDDIINCLAQDLRKPKHETLMTEISMLKDDIEVCLSNIDDWAKPEAVKKSMLSLFDEPIIFNDPYGVALVIGAWNYPLQLPMLPVSGAIAAGNCVIIKPSEVAPATADLLSRLVPRYLNQECVQVVTGGVSETTALLKEKFDIIFYTGSTAVGRIVRDAANKHLTPTVLELGGKSPVYLDDTVNMEAAVKRIMWGKCLNLGQTCVAPDYLLCSKSVEEKFIDIAKKVLREWYGDDAQKSPDLCRIVNNRHFQRIIEYLKDGVPATGGGYDEKDLWIEPTILTNVSSESKVMKEEIFGPLLPIVNVESAYDAIKFINARPKPLAFYAFSSNKDVIDLLTRETFCGGCSVNDVIAHLILPTLPFGGVGPSGMGSYHGKTSFDAFTHRKSCLKRNYNIIADKIGSCRYPPYTDKKINTLLQMTKHRSLPSWTPLMYLLSFGLGALSLYTIQQIKKDSIKEWAFDKIRNIGSK